MSEPVTSALSPGAMVGVYRIERQLGQGAVGTVYAAIEPTIRKRVAIKVLRRTYADDPAMIARFAREARAVNEIRHPAIIDVFATGTLDDGRPYLVMSLLEGRTLRAELEARTRLPPNEAWRVAREIASALDAAHAAGVIHRDLKPDNVFLERHAAESAPRVRVLDFGIAKVEEPIDAEPMKLTATGAPLGTPAYMAPEQWWGTGVTKETDQYALGAMLHELLSGKPPFGAESFAELVQQHVNQKPPLLADVGVRVPEPVQAIVSRMLSKTPADRFPSMRAVIEAGDRAFRAKIEAAVDPRPAPEVAPAAPARAEKTPAPEVTAPPAASAAPGHPAKIALRTLQRYLRIHLAILAAGVATLIAVGYAGHARHRPLEWMRIGGWGQGVIALSLVAGATLVFRVARRRALTGEPSLTGYWIALFPALAGAFNTYVGWTVIQESIRETRALDRFTQFSEGTYEANACRFLGFAVASIFCLSLAALPGVSGMAGATATLPRAPGVRAHEASAAAIALVVVAVVAVVIGAPSAMLVAATAAATLAIGITLPTVHTETAARDELDRAVAGVLAVALAAAVGITRIEASEAVLWGEGTTRAARVADILAAYGEREATLPIAAVSLAVVAAIEALRIRRLSQLGAIKRPRNGTIVLAVVLAMAVVGDLVQHGRFFGRRDELRADLASQFALFARLDPPSGEALDPKRFPPHRATALQITRDVVAVDGRGVARLGALSSPEGTAQVVSDLNHTLAQAALAAGDTGGVDLSISVDRQVQGATVAHLLRIAHKAGVRRVELLLTRGEAPKLTKGPPEIDVVLPSDFVALPAELSEDGLDLAGAGTFGSIAPALIAQAESGTPARISTR